MDEFIFCPALQFAETMFFAFGIPPAAGSRL
jgi:hypothetical protein